MKPSEIVIKYNASINQRDIDKLASLIDDEYVFIDTAGTSIKGKHAGIETWRGFFEQFPDYKNEFEQIKEIDGNSVLVTGKSICNYEPLDGPALWRAKIKDGKLLEWQVYDDTDDNRTKLGIQ